MRRRLPVRLRGGLWAALVKRWHELDRQQDQEYRARWARCPQLYAWRSRLDPERKTQ